jgi:hypothetical protein
MGQKEEDTILPDFQQDHEVKQAFSLLIVTFLLFSGLFYTMSSSCLQIMFCFVLFYHNKNILRCQHVTTN